MEYKVIAQRMESFGLNTKKFDKLVNKAIDEEGWRPVCGIPVDSGMSIICQAMIRADDKKRTA